MLARVAASGVLNLLRCQARGSLCSSQLTCYVQGRENHWQSSLMGLSTALPMRAEPRKKKKVDPRRELAIKDRMKKRLKKLEKAPQELIPIEDFITPYKYMDEARVRDTSPLSFEESERRALLMKKWALHKQQQHKAEMKTIRTLLEAQEKALKELRLESEELYQAAIRRDDDLFPFERQEPVYTPPLPTFEAPEGKCNDVTKVYTH
ncbi:39S ribosomal protein L40, mitochondrial [Eublepharis macularius]|uniref:Large ribosomal subunit protein mL40 n=1 Tax=Eublepharis macularius TaxID=481883 RepID=A0AA97KCL5_EUBMA|nr:39S ribosomal protein L40, mitochondrial [Eublepharis macularius]